MALSLMDTYRLRAEYLEWSGGFLPDSVEKVVEYVDLTMDRNIDPDEGRTSLIDWMESGLDDPPITVPVCTYHGHANQEAIERGEVKEYGAPYLPVKIQNKEGLAIDCGGPGLIVERQSDRWAFFVANQSDGDHEIVVYAMDDGRMVVIEDNDPVYRPPHLTFEREIPAPLPKQQWKHR